MDVMRCDSCRFWLDYDPGVTSRHSGEHVGACRRYPPSVKTYDPYEHDFPDTRPYFWCGEWQPLVVEAGEG